MLAAVSPAAGRTGGSEALGETDLGRGGETAPGPGLDGGNFRDQGFSDIRSRRR